jgi:hypothetical protein
MIFIPFDVWYLQQLSEMERVIEKNQLICERIRESEEENYIPNKT